MIAAVRRPLYSYTRSGSRLYSSRVESLNRIKNEVNNTQINPVGIQQMSPSMRVKVFGKTHRQPDPENIKLAQEHLSLHALLGKKTNITDPIDFPVPKLLGRTLDEHFFKIATEMTSDYKKMAFDLAENTPPDAPKDNWVVQSGWTKYEPGKPPQKVVSPDEDALVFDVEVLYKVSDYPVICTAVSPTAWYGWISPWILGESQSPEHLITLHSSPQQKHVAVGHNVGFDRKRIKEEYQLERNGAFYVDTMSLHVVSNGMCSRQRPQWQKIKKQKQEDEEEFSQSKADNPWFDQSSLNSLADVAYLHCNMKLDKSTRDLFGQYTQQEVKENLQELMNYCAVDVDATFKVYQKVLPLFFKTCPHPVSFVGLKQLSSLFLPINEKWEDYVENAEKCYQQATQMVQEKLEALVDSACKLKDDVEIVKKDPWLSQLDWEIKPVRMFKGKKGQEPYPDPRQKFPGMPNWYKSLFPSRSKPMNLTVRTRIVPLLLKLQWDGHPLVWSESFGWTFKVPIDQNEKYAKANYSLCDMSFDDLKYNQEKGFCYFKVPHKDGSAARCTNPMAKGYVSYFEQGILTSEYEYAKDALDLNAQGSYWISARRRVFNQMPVYAGPNLDMGMPSSKTHKKLGMIIPRTIPMGTITRRAVEDTWLTASNAKRNRIGSEMKAMIQAPPGYKFVGADVDSEELWIASLIGDALFGLHGGTALGWMTLEGSKSEGTDLHSKTASILGISRNSAKIFNYGRIYGAGLKFAASLLRQFNPLTTEEQALQIATKLYDATKGVKTRAKSLSAKQFWRGGSESIVFNMLEEIAEQAEPRTPVLGATITEALTRRNLGASNFLTSRINWSIQSSGVDYLHLLITAMDYLTRKYAINARLCVTVHDEIRYLVKDEDKYRAALALQISNMWTRAMFCQQLGIDDMPQSVAFFSLVDIDSVMRKEVDLECITPSHPNPIPPGEALDINTLLKKTSALREPRKKETLDFDYDTIKYIPQGQTSFITEGKDSSSKAYLEAQITPDASVVKKLAAAASRKAQRLAKDTQKESNTNDTPARKPPTRKKTNAGANKSVEKVRHAAAVPPAKQRKSKSTPTPDAARPGRRPRIAIASSDDGHKLLENFQSINMTHSNGWQHSWDQSAGDDFEALMTDANHVGIVLYNQPQMELGHLEVLPRTGNAY
ncbi:DNA polymerase gamma [Trichomonascus vanleenenianus]|uniref:DNA-directed DNA polymerase gamma MIP1 n=1 Tax=Trichomonascus vanleenenianus TaxID=2268995 RepID=UPI003ECB54FC